MHHPKCFYSHNCCTKYPDKGHNLLHGYTNCPLVGSIWTSSYDLALEIATKLSMQKYRSRKKCLSLGLFYSYCHIHKEIGCAKEWEVRNSRRWLMASVNRFGPVHQSELLLLHLNTSSSNLRWHWWWMLEWCPKIAWSPEFWSENLILNPPPDPSRATFTVEDF